MKKHMNAIATRSCVAKRFAFACPSARPAERGVVACLCVVAALASSSAFGQTIRTWSGATNNTWATTTNWSGSVAAGATSGSTSTDYALFNTNPTNKSPTWTTYLNLAGFTSGSGAGAFTIGTTSGSSAFLTSGGTTSISVGGTAGLTINAPLVILNASGSSSGSYTFLNSTVTNNTALALGGAISGQATTGGTTAISFTASRPANSSNIDRISGAISDGTAGGRLSLTKSGSSILLLTGSNSYTGGTTITGAGSMLTFGGSTSLPATGTVTAGAGSTIGLRVGGATGFTATDIGNLFAGTMTNVSNDANSNVGIDTTNGDFTYSSSIAGTRGLVKLGLNKLTLSASNSFSGGASLSYGTVELGNAAALGSGTVTALGVTLRATTPLTGANKVMNPLIVAGAQATQGQTTFDSTNNIEFGGAVDWRQGNSVLSSGSGTITFSGPQTLTAGLGFGTNGDATSVTFSGPISGANGVTINTNGTMTLSGSNSFTGEIRVGGGTTSTVSFSSGNAVNSSSALRLGTGRLLYTGTGDTVTRNFTLGLSSGATGTATLDHSGTGLLIFSGNVTSGSFAGAVGKFILQGSTSGTGQINNSLPSNIPVSLDKQGTGTWILLASNTYTGATTINAGTLQFGNSGTTGSLPTTSAISGSAGGTLAFNRSNAVAQGTDFSHAISGGLGFAQLGSGSLTLSGSNTFTGPTTAGAGVLRFDTLAAGAGTQSLGGGTVVNLGVTGTTAGELQYFGSGGTLDKNVFALGTGRNRIRNSGAGTLGLSGTLTKDGTILELASGIFNVSGRITGATVGTSDLFINNAAVTLSSTSNDYNGPTYVYGGGTLTLGASGVIPNGSALTLGGTGGDTGSGSIVTGLFTDRVASLTTSSLGGTVGITINGATGGGLTTTGNLTFGAGTDTLNLSLTGLTLGKYSLLTYQGTRSGTFDTVNITNPDSRYTLVYGGASNSAIDLQMKADQANTFTLTPAASRVLVGGSTTLSAVLANSSPTGAAALAWSPTVTGSLTGVSSSLGSSIAAGGTSTITATFLAGNTATAQAWSLVNTDNNAITTTSTASGSISVVNQRTFSVSNSGTINLGNFLRTAAVTGSATVSSTGLNATTANATLGAFSGTNTNGFSLATLDSTVFNGNSLNQSALYTLSGSAASAGAITGSFTSPVTAELGSISAVAVALVGTAYDPAKASFESDLTTSLLVDIGEFNQNSGDHTYGFSIYNLVTDPTYTADLTLVSITDLVTQSNRLSIDLTPGSFGNLAAGGVSNWLATLTSGSTGSFTNQYQLNFVSSKGGQSLGGPQSMTLTVTGVIIVPEPGAIALAGIGIAAAAWAFKRRK